MLAAGADPNGRDDIGYSPLRHAVVFGRLAVADLLLQWGSDINAQDNWHLSILGWAVRSVIRVRENVNFVLARGGIVDEKAIEWAGKIEDKVLSVDILAMLTK